MSGTIVQFDANARTGLIEDDDGRRYFFRATSFTWLPRVGMDIEFDGGVEYQTRVARNVIRAVKRSGR